MQRLPEVCHTLIKMQVTSRTALSNVSQEIVVKGKIIDHPKNTGVDRNKSLIMQKPLSLSDLIVMAILS